MLCVLDESSFMIYRIRWTTMYNVSIEAELNYVRTLLLKKPIYGRACYSLWISHCILTIIRKMLYIFFIS